MKRIDDALKFYWKMMEQFGQQNHRDQVIVGALTRIGRACDFWLDLKEDEVGDGLTGKRRVAITDLRTKAMSQAYILNRKNQGVRQNVRPLAGGYGKELASARPVQGVRTHKTAASASSVVEMMNQKRDNLLMQEQEDALGDIVPLLQNFNLTTISQQDFERAARKIGEVENTFGFQEPEEVLYLKRAGRAEMLVIPGDGKLVDAGGKPVDTGLKKTSMGDVVNKRMYAIDKYGNLLVRNAFGRVDGRNFNHSSLVGGKEVLCAGEIAIREVNGQVGQLIYINNNSGHYQPTVQDLQNALIWLQAEGGLTLDHTKVEDTAPGAANPGPWKGSTFVQNMAAAPDWTAADDMTYQFV